MAHRFHTDGLPDEATLGDAKSDSIYRCGLCRLILEQWYFESNTRCASVPGQAPCKAPVCDNCAERVCRLCGHEIELVKNAWICRVCSDAEGCACAPLTYCAVCQLHRRYADIMQRLRQTHAAEVLEASRLDKASQAESSEEKEDEDEGEGDADEDDDSEAEIEQRAEAMVERILRKRVAERAREEEEQDKKRKAEANGAPAAAAAAPPGDYLDPCSP